ncbi:hypothetical protein H4219_003983 [Mycoemilia scoparia]|uniref:Mediator of RNA polymerase II transcription subunit 13 n=1 Tax=Mycoemilia scoparia TaxID=417184 RepID=A0A9W7ZT56_9FUNG|nr:hypothetical protein H4219_003983 [Mycoemilia scoparia]
MISQFGAEAFIGIKPDSGNNSPKTPESGPCLSKFSPIYKLFEDALWNLIDSGIKDMGASRIGKSKWILSGGYNSMSNPNEPTGVNSNTTPEHHETQWQFHDEAGNRPSILPPNIFHGLGDKVKSEKRPLLIRLEMILSYNGILIIPTVKAMNSLQILSSEHFQQSIYKPNIVVSETSYLLNESNVFKVLLMPEGIFADIINEHNVPMSVSHRKHLEAQWRDAWCTFYCGRVIQPIDNSDKVITTIPQFVWVTLEESGKLLYYPTSLILVSTIPKTHSIAKRLGSLQTSAAQIQTHKQAESPEQSEKADKTDEKDSNISSTTDEEGEIGEIQEDGEIDDEIAPLEDNSKKSVPDDIPLFTQPKNKSRIDSLFENLAEITLTFEKEQKKMQAQMAEESNFLPEETPSQKPSAFIQKSPEKVKKEVLPVSGPVSYEAPKESNVEPPNKKTKTSDEAEKVDSLQENTADKHGAQGETKDFESFPAFAESSNVDRFNLDLPGVSDMDVIGDIGLDLDIQGDSMDLDKEFDFFDMNPEPTGRKDIQISEGITSGPRKKQNDDINFINDIGDSSKSISKSQGKERDTGKTSDDSAEMKDAASRAFSFDESLVDDTFFDNPFGQDSTVTTTAAAAATTTTITTGMSAPTNPAMTFSTQGSITELSVSKNSKDTNTLAYSFPTPTCTMSPDISLSQNTSKENNPFVDATSRDIEIPVDHPSMNLPKLTLAPDLSNLSSTKTKEVGREQTSTTITVGGVPEVYQPIEINFANTDVHGQLTYPDIDHELEESSEQYKPLLSHSAWAERILEKISSGQKKSRILHDKVDNSSKPSQPAKNKRKSTDGPSAPIHDQKNNLEPMKRIWEQTDAHLKFWLKLQKEKLEAWYSKGMTGEELKSPISETSKAENSTLSAIELSRASQPDSLTVFRLMDISSGSPVFSIKPFSLTFSPGSLSGTNSCDLTETPVEAEHKPTDVFGEDDLVTWVKNAATFHRKIDPDKLLEDIVINDDTDISELDNHKKREFSEHSKDYNRITLALSFYSKWVEFLEQFDLHSSSHKTKIIGEAQVGSNLRDTKTLSVVLSRKFGLNINDGSASGTIASANDYYIPGEGEGTLTSRLSNQVSVKSGLDLGLLSEIVRDNPPTNPRYGKFAIKSRRAASNRTPGHSPTQFSVSRGILSENLPPASIFFYSAGIVDKGLGIQLKQRYHESKTWAKYAFKEAMLKTGEIEEGEEGEEVGVGDNTQMAIGDTNLEVDMMGRQVRVNPDETVGLVAHASALRWWETMHIMPISGPKNIAWCGMCLPSESQESTADTLQQYLREVGSTYNSCNMGMFCMLPSSSANECISVPSHIVGNAAAYWTHISKECQKLGSFIAKTIIGSCEEDAGEEEQFKPWSDIEAIVVYLTIPEYQKTEDWLELSVALKEIQNSFEKVLLQSEEYRDLHGLSTTLILIPLPSRLLLSSLDPTNNLQHNNHLPSAREAAQYTYQKCTSLHRHRSANASTQSKSPKATYYRSAVMLSSPAYFQTTETITEPATVGTFDSKKSPVQDKQPKSAGLQSKDLLSPRIHSEEITGQEGHVDIKLNVYPKYREAQAGLAIHTTPGTIGTPLHQIQEQRGEAGIMHVVSTSVQRPGIRDLVKPDNFGSSLSKAILSNPVQRNDNPFTLHIAYKIVGPWVSVSWCDERGEYFSQNIISNKGPKRNDSVLTTEAASAIWNHTMNYRRYFGGKIRGIIAKVEQRIFLQELESWYSVISESVVAELGKDPEMKDTQQSRQPAFGLTDEASPVCEVAFTSISLRPNNEQYMAAEKVHRMNFSSNGISSPQNVCPFEFYIAPHSSSRDQSHLERSNIETKNLSTQVTKSTSAYDISSYSHITSPYKISHRSDSMSAAPSPTPPSASTIGHRHDHLTTAAESPNPGPSSEQQKPAHDTSYAYELESQIQPDHATIFVLPHPIPIMQAPCSDTQNIENSESDVIHSSLVTGFLIYAKNFSGTNPKHREALRPDNAAAGTSSTPLLSKTISAEYCEPARSLSVELVSIIDTKMLVKFYTQTKQQQQEQNLPQSSSATPPSAAQSLQPGPEAAIISNLGHIQYKQYHRPLISQQASWVSERAPQYLRTILRQYHDLGCLSNAIQRNVNNRSSPDTDNDFLPYHIWYVQKLDKVYQLVLNNIS